METLVIKSKDKATSKLLQQLLKEIKGVAEVAVLKESQKEDLAMANAIIQGKTNEQIDTNEFVKQLKNESSY